MLVTTNPLQTPWETSCRWYHDLPKELAAVDELLDDPAFFEPYRVHFSPLLGRPSIPIETYLRMMFLKHRYRLGYERCAGKSPIRSPGRSSAGSRWARRCRTRPRWARSPPAAGRR